MKMVNHNLSKSDWEKYIIEQMIPKKYNFIVLLSRINSFNGKASCQQLYQRFGVEKDFYFRWAISFGKDVNEFFNLVLDIQSEDAFASIPFNIESDEEDYILSIRAELKEAMMILDFSNIDVII